MGGLEAKAARLGYVAGTIPEDKLNAFERLLFRATRGNMFLKHASVGTVVDPTTTEKLEKAVFVVFFAGERARTKILKARGTGLPELNVESPGNSSVDSRGVSIGELFWPSQASVSELSKCKLCCAGPCGCTWPVW